MTLRKDLRGHILLAICLLAVLGGARGALAGAGDREDVLLLEGFEGSWPPAGWAEITTSSVNWSRTNYDSHTGTYSAVCRTTTLYQNEWLVSPALNLSAAVNPKLEFYERVDTWEEGYRHYIMVSTTSQTNPATFTQVAVFTPDSHVVNGFDGDPVTVSLAAFQGQSTVYVAFRLEKPAGATGDIWYVDDVKFYMPTIHDVAAVAVAPDDQQLPGDTVITPQAIVENAGRFAESFDVRMEISQDGAPAYTEVLNVANMAPGQVMTLDFPDFTLPEGHVFILTATTLLAGDEAPENDIATGQVDTYTETHVPLGFLFTNSGCGPCVQANQALDAFTATAGNTVALARIHVWWPYAGDIMYQANIQQSTDLVNEFNVSGVPDFWMDTFYYIGHTGTMMVNALDEARDWKSPMSIDLSWDDDADLLTATVNVANALPPGGDYELFTVIVEDSIWHNGGNGEPLHMQAFRRMYPGTAAGIDVPTSLGSHPIAVSCPLEEAWVYEHLHALAYVRERVSGKTIQAVNRFLTEIGDVSGAPAEGYAFRLQGNSPNPFNPKTTIRYTLDAAGPVTLQVFDLTGRYVTTLVDAVQTVGEHRATWNGTDDAGHAAASGLYLYRLEAGGRSETRKMLLMQ